MMRGKFLRAIVGGVCGALSLILLSVLTRSFNPQGNYSLAVVFSTVAFSLTGLGVIASVNLDSPQPKLPRVWSYLAIVVAGYLTGRIFTLGMLFIYVSFLPMAVILAIVLNGFSQRALKNFIWGLVGSLAGWIVGGTWIIVTAVSAPPNANSIVLSIAFGLVSYGFTLGLLLSQLPPQPKPITAV